MNTRERMACMYAHREADRVPVTDGPWGSTVARWHREGLPENVHWADYFGLDKFTGFHVNNSPRYPVKKIEETDEYSIHTTEWGTTLKQWKSHGGVPEFLDFTIRNADSWRRAKERMTPSRDRINFDDFRKRHAKSLQEGYWISASLWFGFDVTHSWMVGTERVLMAMAEDPEWIVDMWNTQLDVGIALWEMVLAEGYTFDAVTWPDDMGFKLNQFFSIGMYRELLKPVQKRACDWAHSHGMKVELHSCGDIRPFVPELIEIGVDMLNPIEVKAGMDPVALKRQYGDRLAFHGGINAALYPQPEKLYAEMRAVIPQMKKNGGYVISTDHSVPDCVSLEDFRRFVALAKELAAY